jgi:hypothetical protein
MLTEQNDTNQVNTSVEQVDTDVKDGFSVLSADNQVISNELSQIDGAVLHLSAQTDTVICNLDKIAREICVLVNEAAKQTALQTRIAADTYAIRRMYATTNPAAALELDRAEDLKQRIDACCPPPQPQPLCVFEPCPAPAPLNEQPVPSQVPRFGGGQVTQ